MLTHWEKFSSGSTNAIIRRTKPPQNLRDKSPPPATYTNVRNFGNFSRLREKRRRQLKIGFYFFTYEWSRRRLSLIKMINGVEEVLILLFTAFGYEYLFFSVVVRAWKVRLVIREKILFVERHTTKRRRRSNQNIWREKCFNKYI